MNRRAWLLGVLSLGWLGRKAEPVPVGDIWFGPDSEYAEIGMDLARGDSVTVWHVAWGEEGIRRVEIDRNDWVRA